MGKILSLVEWAYQGTLEEQDDTILWMSQILKNSGADINVLLPSNAVNYAIKGQDVSGITIGGVALSNPPRLDKDIESRIGAGVNTFIVEEDLADGGIKQSELVGGVRLVTRSGLIDLFDSHYAIWHWQENF